MKSYELTLTGEIRYNRRYYPRTPFLDAYWEDGGSSWRKEVVKFLAKDAEDAKKQVENGPVYQGLNYHRTRLLRLVEVKDRGGERREREIKFRT